MRKLGIVLLLSVFLSNLCLSQTFRLRADSVIYDIDVMLAPGVATGGQRLFQFSIHSFNPDETIDTDSMFVKTSTGKVLGFLNPVKKGHNPGDVSLWYVHFELNPEEVSLVRDEILTELRIYRNSAWHIVKIDEKPALEIRAVIRKYF